MIGSFFACRSLALKLTPDQVFRRLNLDPLFCSHHERGHSVTYSLGAVPARTALPAAVYRAAAEETVFTRLTLREAVNEFASPATSEGRFFLLAAGTASVVGGAVCIAHGQVQLGTTLVGAGALACITAVWRSRVTADYYIDTINAEQQIYRNAAQQKVRAERNSPAYQAAVEDPKLWEAYVAAARQDRARG